MTTTEVKPYKAPLLKGPRKTFAELQKVNRRRSLVLAVSLILVLGILGALVGAYFGSWLIGVAGGMALAAIQFGIARSAGNKMVLAAMGAKPLDRRDDPQLVNVVEEVAIAAGIPCPTIYLMQDESPNAFATGFKPEDAQVAITTGLREKLNRAELQAVMAHEMGHIRNGDTGYMVLMAVLVGSIALISDMALRSFRYGSFGRSRKSKGGGGGGALILVFLLVFALLAPIFSKLLQAAVSRQREFLADATSVELTREPTALIDALEKLTRDPTPLKSANRAVQHMFIVNPFKRHKLGGNAFSSHPKLADRISRIRRLMG